MPLQRALLRLMLAFLAAAAFAAVIAVISGSTTVLWRIVFTCIEAALASAVVVRLSRFTEKEELRPAAITGFASLLACFGFLLMATWLDLLGTLQQGRLLGSGFATGGLGAVATAALAMRARDQWSVAARAIAIASAATLTATLLATWTDQPKLGAATLAAGPLLHIAGAGLVGRSRTDRPWRFLGVALALAAAGLGAVEAFNPRPNSNHWDWYASLTAASLAVIHANLLMLLQVPRPWNLVRMATIGAAAGCTMGVAFSAFESANLGRILLESALGRVTAAAGILAACGTLGLVARQRLGRRTGPDSVKSVFTTMEVVCPRCCTRQTAPSGDSPCIGCRMVLSVQVREPRCPACGYCLLDLEEDTCPECGHSIPTRGQPLAIATS